jgi:soluble lytic murein transglycosylase-like protein
MSICIKNWNEICCIWDQTVVETDMGIPTRLTIQDYFKQSGRGRFLPKDGTKAAAAVDTTRSGASFAKILDGAHAASTGDTQGLSIRDYMRSRISSQVPASGEKVSAVAHLPSPVAPAPKVTAAYQGDSKIGMQDKTPQPVQSPLEKSRVEVQNRIFASIDQAAEQFGLPPALIKAVVKAESDYRVRALSPAGAQGLMQLMPATARELGVTDPFDIDQNIRAGAQYLRNMLDQFDGDLRLALSAYNAGPGTVARYAGNVPYAETRTYVQRVLRYVEAFSTPEVT